MVTTSTKAISDARQDRKKNLSDKGVFEKTRSTISEKALDQLSAAPSDDWFTSHCEIAVLPLELNAPSNHSNPFAIVPADAAKPVASMNGHRLGGMAPTVCMNHANMTLSEPVQGPSSGSESAEFTILLF